MARADVVKFKKARAAHWAERPHGWGSDAMNVLYVDLERNWRGGQSQALLTLRGLRERG